MELLTPDWKQPRPTAADVEEMCSSIQLTPVTLQSQVLDKFITQVRESHSKGGAHLASFHVGPDHIFDWFASRDRISDEQLFDFLLAHPVVRQELPELFIRPPKRVRSGLVWFDPFLFDGTLSRILYNSGAYSQGHGDGHAEKAFALSVCEAMFGLRFGEVSCYLSEKRWTRWFKGEAWM